MQAIAVELVFVTPEAEELLQLELPAGATVADAIEQSGLVERFPDYPISELPVGIWGKTVPRDQAVRDGDRVELYRKLRVDPMDARRLRASAPDPDPYESR